MPTHPFRAVTGSNVTSEQLAVLLAPDVTLDSPILMKSLRGKALIMHFLMYMIEITGKPHYTVEAKDEQRTLLLWYGIVDGYTLQAATILTDNAAGQTYEITILMRPYPMVTLLQRAMYQQFSSSIPADYWELTPASLKTYQEKAILQSVQPAPLNLTSDAVFHSPVLVKPVEGKERVEMLLQVASVVYGPRSCYATFTTHTQRIALWKSTINDYMLQFLSVLTFNAEREVIDVAVLMRPYPVTTLFRQGMLEQQISFLTPDYFMLPVQPT